VSLPRTATKPAQGPARNWRTAEDATLLIGVGRFAPEKRWPMLVDAVTAASARRPVGMVLAGQGRDLKNIEKRIAGNPHIRILEPITNRAELARVMASADALLHGCEGETFRMVAAEARASGLPLIAPMKAARRIRRGPLAGGSMNSANAGAAAEHHRGILRLRAKAGSTVPAPAFPHRA
jgi:alpha-1,6-mannosyltransferase